jgi:hypothetical protein
MAAARPSVGLPLRGGRSGAHGALGGDPAGDRSGPGQAIDAEGDHSEAVARAVAEQPYRGAELVGQVDLLAGCGAERHARRLVHEQPGVKGLVGPGAPNVRLPGPGGDVPVDPADVVPGLVAGELFRFAAGPEA